VLIPASGAGARRGLSLLEVVVTLVIIAIVAASVYPTVMPRLRSGQTSAIATQLDNLRTAIANYRHAVRRHPRRLAQLTYDLVPGDLDACGSPLSSANRARWDGPYVTRVIDGDFPAADAMIRDTVLRSPPTAGAGPLAQLQIIVTGVENAVAVEIERQFDGNSNLGDGTILWSATGSGLGTLTFQIPISGC
jgi:prepilin-type N-terminal cleavage/methylation domain-containing protein